jgi:hypothetical protein
VRRAREPRGEAEVLLKWVGYRKAAPSAREEALVCTHPNTKTPSDNAMRWRAAKADQAAR